MSKPLRWVLTIKNIILLGWDVDILFVNGLGVEAVLSNIVLRKPMVQKVVGDLAWERAIGKSWVDQTFEDFQRNIQSLKSQVLKVLRTWWIRKSDNIIVPSKYLARWLLSLGVPKNKINIIYNASPAINNFGTIEIPLATEVKIVTVTRLVPWKRVDSLIEVMVQLGEAGLVVIGDGPERSKLEKLSEKLGVTDRIYFAGQKEKAEVLSLMSACDIFVLNSTYEGFPHVLLEAMFLQLPVVATAVGGVPEAIENGKTGMLISTKAQSLKNALQLLIKDQGFRHELAVAGYLKVRENFGIERMVSKTEAVLSDTAAIGK
jgi:glycosyltransferase involved in cell wall biosynthesis